MNLTDPPSLTTTREAGGRSDNDGYVLTAHPGRSQGRPRTTPGSQPIGYRRPAPPVLPRSSPCPGTPILPKTPDDPCPAVSSPDNGTCFKRRWHDACDELAAVPKTRPYRPQTNGKAERFIRTLLERWAYAYSYPTEADRAAALPNALDSYNRYRPHRALGGHTPLQRVNDLSGTNN
jgi:hypothetical protein